MLKTSICVGWFNKVSLRKVIRSNQILIDEDTCWKFGEDEVPEGYEGPRERLSFKVNAERWDLVPGEVIKFMDEKLVTFTRPW